MTTGTPAPSGGAGLNSGPIAFVNNTGDKTLTSVALKGDSGNAVVNTIPAADFENVALGDMQFSIRRSTAFKKDMDKSQKSIP